MWPIVIYLNSNETRALLNFALSDGRTPQEQAKVVVIEALEESGYLKSSEEAEDAIQI